MLCLRSSLACLSGQLWTCAHTQHIYRSRAEPLFLNVSTDARQSWQGPPHASLAVQLSNSALLSPFSPLLQELVSHPISLDDEASEAGRELEADDALLSDQQRAAQSRPEERQHLPTAEPAPDNKAAEQVRQLPPA